MPIFLALLALGLSGCGEDPVGTSRRCGSTPALVPGERQVAALSRDDPVLDGSFIDYYTVRAAGAAAITLEMTSEAAVDPFLYLWREGERDPATQAYAPDSSAAPRVARLQFDVDAGCYLIGASSWGEQVGAYAILLELEPIAP